MKSKIRLPKVSKDPNTDWRKNAIQFSRFIAEVEGVLEQHQWEQLMESMDLTIDELDEIVEHAQSIWTENNH